LLLLLLLLLLMCGQQSCSKPLCWGARSREPFLRPPSQVWLPVVERGACGPARGCAGRSATTVKATCAPPREHMRSWAGAQKVTCNKHAKRLCINIPIINLFQTAFPQILLRKEDTCHKWDRSSTKQRKSPRNE
jgi:hypothetical protein